VVLFVIYWVWQRRTKAIEEKKTEEKNEQYIKEITKELSKPRQEKTTDPEIAGDLALNAQTTNTLITGSVQQTTLPASSHGGGGAADDSNNTKSDDDDVLAVIG